MTNPLDLKNLSFSTLLSVYRHLASIANENTTEAEHGFRHAVAAELDRREQGKAS
jgi:hypothetical protein